MFIYSSNRMPKMLRYSGFLFVILEIIAFVLVVGWVGIGTTLLLILFTTLFGIHLLRNHGLNSMMEFNQSMGTADPKEMSKKGLYMLAGMLLFFPGFITDVVGILLLIPAFRQVLARLILSKADTAAGPRAANQPYSSNPKDDKQAPTEPSEGETIEGEYWRDED